MQALLDSFRAKSSAGKVTGILPINVSFPRIRTVDLSRVRTYRRGPVLPAAEFSFARDKKGGVR